MFVENISSIIAVMCNDMNSVNIGILFIVFAICSALVKRDGSEETKKWCGSIFGIMYIFLVGGLCHLWHVMLYGIAGSVLVAYADKRSCHKVAFVFMFAVFTLYGIFEKFFLEEIYYNNSIRGVQMTMICKIVGVAFEINNSHKIKESLKNGEKNISEDEVVDPNLSHLLHYTFFVGIYGPYFTYRTFNDYLTLPFSRVVGLSFALRQCIKATILYCIYESINYYWPLDHCLTSEFAQSSFFYQTIFILSQYQRMLFWISAVNGWSEFVFTAIGLGAYPTQCMNESGHGPLQNYSAIKKVTYAEAEKMQYDFKSIETMDILMLESTPWMSEQVRGWNKGIQYFLWKCARQPLPRTGPLKRYRILITCLVSSLWHGVQAGCFTGLLSIPACVWVEKPYKIIIYEHLSGWIKSTSLLCMYLFRVYMYGFAMTTLMLGEFGKIYKFSTSAYFMPIIVFIFVHLLGRVLILYFNKNKKPTYKDCVPYQ